MKKFVFILSMIFQLNSYAQENEVVPAMDSLNEIQIKSEQIDVSNKSCQDLLNDHIAIVDESEKLIDNLSKKEAVNITQYEITTLLKSLMNRYAHLDKVLESYSDKNEVKSCSPSVLGDAIAIYDFTHLGSKALQDKKLRRMIYAFTRTPKYHLEKIKKMYQDYSSPLAIQILHDRVKAEKITLPTNLVINEKISNGHFYELSDVAVRGTSSVIAGAARVWGFLSDKFKWRNGYLNGNQEVLSTLKSNLRPLDIIYEKRDFTLSNYTIPGHWGHVAVWLGTKEELVQLGVWDKDFFEPFKEAVLQGKNIVEIRKKGMNFVSLSDFINIDEIAVTRIKNAEANSEEILKNIAGEIDATYDFTFNAQTPDELTCSEMIAFSFGNIHWPEMDNFLGVTVTPDDIAELSLYKDSPAEFVLYIKGNKNNAFNKKSVADWKQLFHLQKELQYN